MTSTIELLYRFKGDDSNGECSRKLSVGATTLVMARKRGRLSPELAAEIAEKLGENAVFWMAVAAAEAQVEPARSKLLGLIEMDSTWRARRDSNPRPLPSEGVKSRRTERNKYKKMSFKWLTLILQPASLCQAQGAHIAL